MVERKKTDKEKKTVQIKATTGAWWKSKPSDEPVVPPASQEEVKKVVKDEAKEVKPKRVPRPKKTTSTAVKTPRKTTRPVTKKKVEDAGNDTILAADEQKSSEPPKAPARKRPAPKKKVLRMSR